jgi:hypothetical protein
MTLMFRSRLSLLFPFILLFAAAAAGQIRTLSGNYEGLMIGIDPDGHLTGYFDQATGDDGKGNPRFTCRFLIRGEEAGGGRYKILTWHPASPDEVIEGELRSLDAGRSLNIRLFGEHGGCWNVSPELKADAGVDMDLSEAGEWKAVRVVSAEKAYFHRSANNRNKLRSFLVRKDTVGVLNTKGAWLEVTFTAPNGRKTTGWMRASVFYSSGL